MIRDVHYAAEVVRRGVRQRTDQSVPVALARVGGFSSPPPMQRRAGRPWKTLVAAGLVLAGAGCSPTASAPPVHSVRYVLEWKRSNVTEEPDGWDVTNDLGYRVHVTRGYVVTRSLELIPCNPAPPPVSLLDAITDLLGPRIAHAGHSAIADPSATKTAEVESLLSPRAHTAATLQPGAQKYCQLHYLIARAEPSATGLPSEVDMVDQSVRIEGSFQPPTGESSPTLFALVTAVANGRLFDLPRRGQESFALDTGTASGVVVVRRNLDSIFNHVDFANMNERRLGREILQNLINDTEIELEVHGDE